MTTFAEIEHNNRVRLDIEMVQAAYKLLDDRGWSGVKHNDSVSQTMSVKEMIEELEDQIKLLKFLKDYLDRPRTR